jgi:uncharacterized protein
MNSPYPRRSATLALLASLVFSGCTSAPLRVLYFSKSAGWEHDVVKHVDGRPSYSENILAALGPKQGIKFTFSKDGSLFSSRYLAQFDAVLFYTSGDLSSAGTDGQPALTEAGRQALFDYVAGGRGFIGLHSTSDTFHTNERGGGNPVIRRPRFMNYGEAADPFIKFLGGEFIRHGPQQVARAALVDRNFPGFGGIGPELNVNEEWYTLKEFAADDHVLLVMQTAGMQGADYVRPPYPLAWARRYGKGRVAFNVMGHREDVWDSAAYQAMIVGMIKWAAGRVDADLRPNLEQVTPGHATLQALTPDVK